jgi:hypothetical protein
MLRLLDNICREIARNGCTKIVLVNAHGSNFGLLSFFNMLPLYNPRDMVQNVVQAVRAIKAEARPGGCRMSSLRVRPRRAHRRLWLLPLHPKEKKEYSAGRPRWYTLVAKHRIIRSEARMKKSVGEPLGDLLGLSFCRSGRAPNTQPSRRDPAGAVCQIRRPEPPGEVLQRWHSTRHRSGLQQPSSSCARSLGNPRV